MRCDFHFDGQDSANPTNHQKISSKNPEEESQKWISEPGESSRSEQRDGCLLLFVIGSTQRQRRSLNLFLLDKYCCQAQTEFLMLMLKNYCDRVWGEYIGEVHGRFEADEEEKLNKQENEERNKGIWKLKIFRRFFCFTRWFCFAT